MEPKRIAFAGAGLSCAVMARQLAEIEGVSCTLFEKKNHVGGNCHTSRDPETGVMVHNYGPHIFHTSNEAVWNYVNRFASFGPFVNRVKAVTPRGVYSLPINLLTLNQFFGRNFSPKEAQTFVTELARPFKGLDEKTFEGVALGLVGEELYQNFFYGYTKKQWGCEPRLLPGDVIKRLPLRFNYDDNYYRDFHQGIPREGYTAMIEGILSHPSITVKLGQSVEPGEWKDFDHVVYSGPIDAFHGFRHGRLSYRTVYWKTERLDGDAQGVACLNYTAEDVPHTRTIEHKHFAPWEEHAKTVFSTEYSKATTPQDEPFYPVRAASDLEMLRHYIDEAKKAPSTSFVGRLGTYRYLDMHIVIEESLRFADQLAKSLAEGTRPATFPVSEEKLLA